MPTELTTRQDQANALPAVLGVLLRFDAVFEADEQ